MGRKETERERSGGREDRGRKEEGMGVRGKRRGVKITPCPGAKIHGCGPGCNFIAPSAVRIASCLMAVKKQQICASCERVDGHQIAPPPPPVKRSTARFVNRSLRTSPSSSDGATDGTMTNEVNRFSEHRGAGRNQLSFRLLISDSHLSTMHAIRETRRKSATPSSKRLPQVT